ncbi:phosphotransferase family protein [Nocardia nepalensis]|uniref:phosphotransferase family protein n=1 Tax=Nocardia nepalensis TaxID=3375448 RepID=UPI003B675B2C
MLHRTDKTMLAVGELSGERVAIKCLVDPDPFWAAKWRHELGVYQAFTATPPPLRVPKLLYTDNSRLLVLEWLEGRRLDDDRYPQRPLTGAETDAVLRCVESFNQWQPAAGGFEIVFDYQDRFRRYHAQGWLTDTDLVALQQLLAQTGPPIQINHGDPIASNFLLDDGNDATLLDWEFTGLFLPGFDLAMLHTQLGAHTPALKEHIDTAVAASGSAAPFIVNLAAVLTRELRIHHELLAGPMRDARLPLIETAWAQARDRLHRHTTSET